MAQVKKRFHELLREARENARQSAEVMAILLSMEEAEYRALERGAKLPDNETLKRLCMMMEWNYYDTRRMIANEMTAPPISGAGHEAQGHSTEQALDSLPLQNRAVGEGKGFDTLGARLKEVRLRTGQEVDIIAKLLNIAPEDYRRLEAGEHPNGELLRRISIIYDWNHHDLLTLLRSEKAKELQPRQIGNPFPGASPLAPALKSLLEEMQGLFPRIPEKSQQMVLSQLELVRETMRRMQQAS